MALLGDSWDDPKSAAIMALSAGLLGRNFAGGLMGANQAYAQGKAAQQKAEIDKLQIDMMREDHALKRQQMQQALQMQQQADAWFKSKMLGTPTYQPGQLGSGSFGAVPNANPLSSPPSGVGLANLTPEDIVMGEKFGFKLIEPWKIAKQGFELKPNSYRVDPGTNRREYIPDVKEGITMDPSGNVVNMPGATQALMERTMAAEAAKALLASAGRLNLRDQPDGTQVPVSELSENPTLRNVLGSVFGGAPIPRAANGPAAPVQRQSAPVSQPSGANVITPDAQRVADQEAMRMIRSELSATTDPQVRAGLERELARFEAAQSRPGFPTATARITPNAAPAQGAGYGKTTAQKTQDEAVKAATLGINESWLKNSYEPVRAAGSAASDALTNISVARSAMANMGATGWGTDAKAAAAGVLSGLGLAPKSVQKFAADAETFQNAMATNLQTVLNAAKGPQTEGDADRARQTFAQLKNTTQANEFLLDLAQAKAERDAMKAKFYDGALPIARGKGDLTEVDREWSRLQPSVFSMPSMTKWGVK